MAPGHRPVAPFRWTQLAARVCTPSHSAHYIRAVDRGCALTTHSGGRYSDNLVDWTVSKTVYSGMGGSGTLIYDAHRNLTVALTGTVSAFTCTSSDLQTSFTPAGQIFKTVDPLPAAHGQHVGCWDPMIWWDERVAQ